MSVDNSTENEGSIPEILTRENDKRIARVLKEVESNFKTSIAGHIEYHRYLENEAMNAGEVLRAKHHAIRRQLYQQILNNYSLSQIYDRP